MCSLQFVFVIVSLSTLDRSKTCDVPSVKLHVSLECLAQLTKGLYYIWDTHNGWSSLSEIFSDLHRRGLSCLQLQRE